MENTEQAEEEALLIPQILGQPLIEQHSRRGCSDASGSAEKFHPAQVAGIRDTAPVVLEVGCSAQAEAAYCAAGKGDSAAHKRLRWGTQEGLWGKQLQGDALHYLLSHSNVLHVLCLLLQRGKQALGL